MLPRKVAQVIFQFLVVHKSRQVTDTTVKRHISDSVGIALCTQEVSELYLYLLLRYGVVKKPPEQTRLFSMQKTGVPWVRKKFITQRKMHVGS